MFDQKTSQKDIKAIIFKYLKYWYLFVAGAVIALIIAFIYLRYTTPMFVAKTSILFKDDSGGPSESAVFSDISGFNTNRSIDNEILILKSNSLMERVVQELKLEVKYVVEGTVRDVEIYGEDLKFQVIPKDFSSKFYGKSFKIFFKNDNTFELHDGATETYSFGQEIVKPYGVFTIISRSDATFSSENKPLTISFRNVEDLAKGYSNKLGVGSINKEASALMISITDAVPNRAKDILGKLVEVYEKESIEDKNQIAQKSVEFINDRLVYLTQELSQVEQNVEEYKQQYELTDVSSQGQEYVASASASRKELENVNVQINVLRSIESYLKSQGGGDEYELVPSSLSISDMTLSGLITQFNAIQLDRERLLRNSRPNNPVILNMNEQLKNLRNNILENLKNIRSGLYITKRSLEAQLGFVGDKIQQVPVREREYVEITRQQETKQALYLYLLQKKEESALSLASAVSNTRIIDPPVAKGPVSPNKTNTMAYSLILGLFVPFLGLYIKYLFTNKIERRSEVLNLTETPILGEICHEKSGETVVANAHKRTPIAEMFRLLRTNLRFSLAGKENKVVLITSSMSGEGKTFFCINMGASLAGAGKKVIILEFDLRRPKLVKSLGINKSKGLTDYLVGDIENVNDVIRSTDVDPNLDIISAGTLPPNPAEIILNERVKTLIKEMKARYDYVILDCPPVGKVADALTLNEHIDTSIYIVRYNYTDKDQIKIIDDIFINQKLRNPLIVLNDSKKANSGNYVYGY